MIYNKRNKLKNINFTELTPVRKYEHEIDDNGFVRVLVPKFTDPIFSRILQPRIKDKYIRADFDELGTEVWLSIDGDKKLNDIVLQLREKLGDKIEPAYERITLFLQNLHKNKLIFFHELV